jgi:ubiquinone/menaquinone biosynthesis C-methylase UbiE
MMGHYEEDEQATKAGYDRWAPSYDDRDPSTWLDEPFLLTHLQPFPGCRILDVGCGTGRYIRQWAPSAYRIIGIDLSRNMLARTRQQTGGRTDVCLVQASGSLLPFQPGSFDRLMSGLVLDHMASVQGLISEMSAVLTIHGRAVLAAIHPEMQRLTGRDIDIRSHTEAIHIPGHIHEVDQLLAAARDAAMTVVAMDEPRVTTAMVEQYPRWKSKIGRPALLLLALEKRDRGRPT